MSARPVVARAASLGVRVMGEIDTVVVGAGHAGLAVSRLLAAAGHEHVILERGRVGERWRSRAVGFAAPGDAELDDPAARVSLPGCGSGRVPARGRVR